MNNDVEIHVDDVDAKAGRKVKGMTTVLVISTLVAVAILSGIFISSAS